MFNAENALAVLSSLIVVIPKGTRKEVYLAHYSMKESLSSERASQSPSSAFVLESSQAHEDIMQNYLCHLGCAKLLLGNYREMDQPRTGNDHELSGDVSGVAVGQVRARLKEDLPLLDYACSQWFFHAGVAKNSSSLQAAAECLGSKEDVKFWSMFFNPDDHELRWTSRYWVITRNDQNLLKILVDACRSKRCSRCGHVEATARAEMVRLAAIGRYSLLKPGNKELEDEDLVII